MNAAILLRRPLLVSGKPGSGKSSLPYAIAHELGLGRVLRWPVNSTSRLNDGLYSYDAVGRLQEVSLRMGLLQPMPTAPDAAPALSEPGAVPSQSLSGEGLGKPADIGRFLRLGPLGTALLPYAHPRVLLIDEVDKSDLEFPGDLLNIVEDGYFTITELARIKHDAPRVTVLSDDPNGTALVEDGLVRCSAFPIIVMTSNGDRDFPPAFYRRCIRLEIADPGPHELRRIVEAQLGDSTEATEALIEEFLLRRDGDGRMVATDQLLNAIYLRMSDLLPASLRTALLRPIDGGAG